MSHLSTSKDLQQRNRAPMENPQSSQGNLDVVVERRPAGYGQKALGFAKGGVKQVGGVFQDFKNFIDRGNVIDLAVGIVIGAAFTAIVTSFVADIVTPLIGLPGSIQLSNQFAILKKPGKTNRTECTEDRCGFATPKQAQDSGFITLNYGNFIQSIINFLLIAVIVFFIVKTYSAAFRRKKPEPKTKSCPFCCKDIPIKARRCPECTSHLPSEDDLEPPRMAMTHAQKY